MLQNSTIRSRELKTALESTSKSVLLLGPRQTGKSTLIRSLAPDLVVNLARQSEFLDHQANPSLLEELIRMKSPKTVMIDEVQRIPDLLNTIQALLDEQKFASLQGEGAVLKFFLTGSSARKLRRGGANLIPGRILSYELGPLTAKELEYRLDVERALALGTLPEMVTTSDRAVCEELLRTYAETYLREEIQAELAIRTLSGFVRFLHVAAEHSGQYLDFSKLAKRAKVPRQSAVQYFEVLEDTLIAHRLGPCAWAPGADQVKHPRFFFFDVGVLNGVLKDFSVSGARKGVMFEHLVHSQIRSTSQSLRVPIEIQNFRTRSGVEVDFVFKWRDDVIAVECKATRDPLKEDANSLVRFAAHCEVPVRLYLVCPETQARQVGDVKILGLNDFLRELQ